MKEIIFDNVEKRYGENVVIPQLNLKVEPGERLILLGPSGCGKSTTLRMIAGLEEISSGNLIMNERVVNDVAPGDRDVSMVFQNYALYPHMTVEENITYGLKANKVERREIDYRLKNVLDMLALNEYKDRKPNQLSGGQRQRVALARSLAKKSSYLLLDEPLSNLDAQLRLQARRELVRLHNNFNMTFVYVIFDHERRFAPESSILHAISKNLSDKYYLGIRPENIRLVDENTANSIKVKVIYLENLGSVTSYHFDLANTTACLTSENHSIKVGDDINIVLVDKFINLFDYVSEENITRR